MGGDCGRPRRAFWREAQLDATVHCGAWAAIGNPCRHNNLQKGDHSTVIQMFDVVRRYRGLEAGHT